LTPTVDSEAETAKYGASLVGREVGTVEAGEERQHLLWWEPSPADNDVVLDDGLRVDALEQRLDDRGIELVAVACDRCDRHPSPSVPLPRTLCIVLSVLYLRG